MNISQIPFPITSETEKRFASAYSTDDSNLLAIPTTSDQKNTPTPKREILKIHIRIINTQKIKDIYRERERRRRNEEMVTFAADLTESLVLPAMGRVAAVRHDPFPPPRTLGQGSPETNRSRSIGGQIGRQNGNGNGRETGGSGVLFPSLFLFPLFSFLFVVVRSSLAWDVGKDGNGFPKEKHGNRDFGYLVNGLPLRARAL